METLLKRTTKTTAHILWRALEGRELSSGEAAQLLSVDGDDLEAVCRVADHFRTMTHGRDTSFVVTRNINFTNVCAMGCNFCGFARSATDSDAALLSLEEIAHRTLEAHERGATEVCIQGGLHPAIGGDHYRNIILAAKRAVPSMHVHAFSPFEILYGSRKSKLSYSDFLIDLMECGLGSIPGTAAEILDTEIRQILTKNKLSAAAWVEIIKAAHEVGLRSTATMMYGHVDGPIHWANHLALIRDIQKETGGFTEFVPLGFVHYDSPLYVNRQAAGKNVRPGPTTRENIAVHAVSRILLHEHINNIQVSWVKLGPKFAQNAQRFGVNDLGGTLMNESISRSSGALFGQEITASEMRKLINESGFEPWERTTLYDRARKPQMLPAIPQAPLVPRTRWQTEQILDPASASGYPDLSQPCPSERVDK